MYESLVVYLLGKRGLLSDEDVDSFIDILRRECNIETAPAQVERQANLVGGTDRRQKVEEAVKDLLELNDVAEHVDLLEEGGKGQPSDSHKLSRKRAEHKELLSQSNLQPSQTDNLQPSQTDNLQPSQTDNLQPSQTDTDVSAISFKNIFGGATQDFSNKVSGENEFNFNIGDLEENHFEGPEVDFNI